MENPNDYMLIQFVQREIAAGKQSIIVPSELVRETSPEVQKEVRSLCKISGVSIKGLG